MANVELKNIEVIDEKFALIKKVDRTGLKIYNPTEAPFDLYGLIPPTEDEPFYHRMPLSVAEETSGAVMRLNYHTSGGRVRFKTTSKRVAIFVKMHRIDKMGHFTLIGSSGFDLYVGENFKCSFMPHISLDDNGYEDIKTISKNNEMKDVTINFPLYSGVTELLIGLDEDAAVEHGSKYRFDKPVVYYGSSITQGGCASRPGNCYQNMITRRLNCDYINLGFSGSAKGEKSIRDYIADLNMQAFVLDYDHNAPTLEHLEATHEVLFKTVREKNPTLPIVIVPAPRNYYTKEFEDRFDVIKRTYDNAVKNGDENVYFVDMHNVLFDFSQDDCTVDGIHPNDLGFRAMANVIGDALERAFNKDKEMTSGKR